MQFTTNLGFKEKKLESLIFFLISLIPITLIFSRAVSDMICVILILIFLPKIKNFLIFCKENFLLEVKIFIIFISYLLINCIFSEYPKLSFSRALPYFRFILFTLFLIFYFKYLEEKKLKFFFKYIIFVCIIICFFNILDFLFTQLSQNNLIFQEQKAFEYRATGLFKKVVAGSYLSKFIPIAICGIYFLEFKKITSLLICLFLFSGIVVTGERSSILFLLLVLFFSFLFIKKIRGFIFLYSTLCALIFLLVMLFFPHYKARIIDSTLYNFGMQNFIKKENLNEAYHITGGTVLNEIKSFKDSQHGSHFLTAYNIFLDHKLIGSGLKTYRKVSQDKKYENINSSNFHLRVSTHPHNYFLEIASELGLIGLIIFMLLPIVIIYRLVLFKKLLNNKFYLSMPLIVSFTYFWPIITTGSFFTNWNSIIFWFIFGFGMGLCFRFKKV